MCLLFSPRRLPPAPPRPPLLRCRSLMERAVQLNVPAAMLSESYRMHPDICSAISQEFYGGGLVTAPEVAARRAVPQPCRFVHVPKSSEQHHPGGGYSNKEEARRCTRALRDHLQLGLLLRSRRPAAAAALLPLRWAAGRSRRRSRLPRSCAASGCGTPLCTLSACTTCSETCSHGSCSGRARAQRCGRPPPARWACRGWRWGGEMARHPCARVCRRSASAGMQRHTSWPTCRPMCRRAAATRQVLSVDACQGAEADAVIVSTVRAQGHLSRLGGGPGAAEGPEGGQGSTWHSRSHPHPPTHSPPALRLSAAAAFFVTAAASTWLCHAPATCQSCAGTATCWPCQRRSPGAACWRATAAWRRREAAAPPGCPERPTAELRRRVGSGCDVSCYLMSCTRKRWWRKRGGRGPGAQAAGACHQ